MVFDEVILVPTICMLDDDEEDVPCTDQSSVGGICGVDMPDKLSPETETESVRTVFSVMFRESTVAFTFTSANASAIIASIESATFLIIV